MALGKIKDPILKARNAAIREAEKLASRTTVNRPPATITVPNPLHDVSAQVGGGHYRADELHCPHCRRNLQLWDVLRHTFFAEGSAIKHIFRHRTKNGLQDLLKARQYIDKIIATEYPEAEGK
jgi:hypothetical protein